MKFPAQNRPLTYGAVLVALPLLFPLACSKSSDNGGNTGGQSGGTSSSGRSKGTGGATGKGGSGGDSSGSARGGSTSSGGASGGGGATPSSTSGGSGGGVASGGTNSSGGSGGSGGKGGTAGGGAGGGSGGSPGPGGSGGRSSAIGGGGSGGSAVSSSGSSGGTAGSGGASRSGGTAGGGIASGGTSGSGGTAAGGSSTTSTYGYLPVPSSVNATRADPKAWWTTWKAAYYQDCPNGSGRIASNGNETVSEGIGYGMLMAVNNDDEPATFNKLWAYYKAHEDANGLMNWKINGCDSGSTGQYAATDADEDVAMALVQADTKWGGFKTDATTLISAIKKHETAAGPPSYLLPGDAPNGWAAGTVNPSYFAIGYWHVWATYTNDPFWNTLATDAYTALAAYQKLSISGSTGLVPNWGMISGTATDANYGYDACRTPWRVAVDYIWFQTPAAQTVLQGFSTYVDGKNGVANVPFDKNSAFVGGFALSGMAVSQSKADQYLNDWLSANLSDTPYFQGALKGLYLLVAAHKFLRGN